MSTATTETVTVAHEALVDAIAALLAADNILNDLNGGPESLFGDYFTVQACTLRGAAFPEVDALSEDDATPYDVYASHPVVVETDARSSEIEAELLWKLRRPSALERALSDDDYHELSGRARKLERYAEEVRTAGSIDVRFPSES